MTMKNKDANSIKLGVVSRADFWRGFSEEQYVRTPTAAERQRMLQYPVIRSAVKMISLPLLAAKPNVQSDDPRQKQMVEEFFNRHYRMCATTMLWKGIAYGFCAGEKVYQPTVIDGATYLMLKNIIAPPPENINIKFDDQLNIDGFEYESVRITREKTALYIYQGNETNRPYGLSICDDVFWSWVQVMEDWSRFAIYKDFKAIPPMILEYPEERVADGSGGYIDINETKAQERLKLLRTLAGVALPKRYNKETRQWEAIWNLREIQMTDKTPAFLESINKHESEIFIGALIPKRIIEQDMQVGAYAMLREQADFFYFILQARLEEWEEYLRRWIIDPMLQLNFTNAAVSINLDFGDELMQWYLGLIEKAVVSGYVSPDYDEIMTRLGVPHDTTKEEPRIETERAHFQSTKQKQPTRKMIQETKDKIALEFTKKQNRFLMPLKDKVYDEIVAPLRQVQGQMALRVVALFKTPWKQEELERAVQIPRKPFENMLQHLTDAYNIGSDLVYEKAKLDKPDKMSANATKDLRLLAMKFAGTNLVGGQPEMLEERLFYACMSVARPEEVLHAFTRAFNNYIEVTLPDNVGNELNIATQLGVKYASQEAMIRKMQAMKEGKA